jgi:hypothetical protein
VPESARDELYGLDRTAFTASRNDLAKRLKAEGRADEAAQVARLRKPPLTVWALNRVARHQEGLIEAVLRSGALLRDATSQTLRGDRSGLVTAQAQTRRAVEAAVDAATLYLAAEGHTAGEVARRKMTETLRAAAVDEVVADQVARGVLDGEKESIGFDVLPVGSSGEGTRARRSVDTRKETSSAARRHAALRKRLMTERAELQDKADRARQAADDAAAKAAHLSVLADDADEKLLEVQRRLEELGEDPA